MPMCWRLNRAFHGWSNGTEPSTCCGTESKLARIILKENLRGADFLCPNCRHASSLASRHGQGHAQPNRVTGRKGVLPEDSICKLSRCKPLASAHCRAYASHGGLCSWITHASLFHLGQRPQVGIVRRRRLLWRRPFAVDRKERFNSHYRNRKKENPPGKAFKTLTETEAHRRDFQQVPDHACEQIR